MVQPSACKVLLLLTTTLSTMWHVLLVFSQPLNATWWCRLGTAAALYGRAAPVLLYGWFIALQLAS